MIGHHIRLRGRRLFSPRSGTAQRPKPPPPGSDPVRCPGFSVSYRLVPELPFRPQVAARAPGLPPRQPGGGWPAYARLITSTWAGVHRLDLAVTARVTRPVRSPAAAARADLVIGPYRIGNSSSTRLDRRMFSAVLPHRDVDFARSRRVGARTPGRRRSSSSNSSSLPSVSCSSSPGRARVPNGREHDVRLASRGPRVCPPSELRLCGCSAPNVF